MRTVIVALTLVLAGCGSQAGKDGYAFERKEFDRAEVSVTLVEHPSLAALQAAAAARGVTADNVAAWSVLKTGQPACEVHIVDPAVRYQPEYLGHEIAHCFYGRWHS